MISEEHEEQAALYALGLLDANEVEDFRRAMAADADLRALAVELRDAAATIALGAGPAQIQPSFGLKTRVLADVAREAPGAPVPPAKIVRGPWTVWLPWALAATAAAAAFASLLDRQSLVGERAHAYALWRDSLALRDHEAIERHYAEEARQQTTPLGQVVVCQLEPTADGPAQPRVAVVWDPARRQGELFVARLKPPANGHDYQLWAVEEGRKDTVSAGVVHVDGEGRARVGFTPAGDSGETVRAFALSLEQAGGSEKNQGPILLLGKL